MTLVSLLMRSTFEQNLFMNFHCKVIPSYIFSQVRRFLCCATVCGTEELFEWLSFHFNPLRLTLSVLPSTTTLLTHCMALRASSERRQVTQALALGPQGEKKQDITNYSDSTRIFPTLPIPHRHSKLFYKVFLFIKQNLKTQITLRTLNFPYSKCNT